MKRNNETIGYGLKNNVLVHISEVEAGLCCECICPHCQSRLIAKKGEVNEHHFAHYVGEACEGAYESMMHFLGKQIIANHKKVKSPEQIIEVQLADMVGHVHVKSIIRHGEIIRFEEVQLEKAVGDFRPDIIARKDLLDTYYIEIVVSNDVDNEKLLKVEGNGISMMRIDLSSIDPLLPLDVIEDIVLNSAPREWVYERYADSIAQELKEELGDEIVEINEEIKRIVAIELSKDIKHSQMAIPMKRENQLILLGYKSCYGHSSKTGRDFDFSTLLIAEAVGDIKHTANYKERGKGGYDYSTLDFNVDLLPTLERLNFPCVAQVEVEYMYGRYGKPKLVAKSILI